MAITPNEARVAVNFVREHGPFTGNEEMDKNRMQAFDLAIAFIDQCQSAPVSDEKVEEAMDTLSSGVRGVPHLKAKSVIRQALSQSAVGYDRLIKMAAMSRILHKLSWPNNGYGVGDILVILTKALFTKGTQEG